MAKAIDLVGKRFGRLVVLKRDENKKSKSVYWICQCDCGNIKSIDGASLRRSNGTRSCGCLSKERSSETHLIDLTGKIFGRLTVLRRDMSKTGKNRSSYWLCQCKCGNIKSIDGSSLRRGITTSCGCYMQEQKGKSYLKDLTGQRFGRLTVIKQLPNLKTEKHSYPQWECECDCGETVITTSSTLCSGNISSCGCLRRERHRKTVTQDLTNMRFGKLTVIELDEETSKKKKQIYWKCQCDCGNIKIALGETLRKNQVNSCGCLVSKGEERLIKILKENNYIFSTQYCFNDLRGEQLPLRFDFVIFDSNQNIECLIEYQGKQHYEQSEYFGGEDSFIKQRKYDALKKEYCKIHNIKLIEIPYWDFDKINAEYLQQKIFNGGERSALKRHC